MHYVMSAPSYKISPKSDNPPLSIDDIQQFLRPVLGAALKELLVLWGEWTELNLHQVCAEHRLAVDIDIHGYLHIQGGPKTNHIKSV